MAKDLSHEELQRDEVAESIQELTDGVKKHRHLIVTVIVLTGVAIVGMNFWRSGQHARIEQSSDLLVKTINLYQSFENQPLPEDRERVFEDALKAVDTLQTEYANTKPAALGEYIKGHLYFQMDKFDEAAAAYKKFLASASTAEQKAQAQIALGYTAENAAFLMEDAAEQKTSADEAMSHYEAAAKLVPAGNFLNYYAKLGEARLYELTGEDQQALDLLTELAANPPLAGPEVDEDDVKELEDPIGNVMRVSLLTYQDQIRLGATAQLRLDRLQAKMGIEAPVATVTAE